MAERKVYTEEQKAEIKRRRDERNAAVKALIESILADKDGFLTEEMKELAKIAAPKSNAGTGTKRSSVMDTVRGYFDDKDEADEIEVFQDLKMGRQEMATAVKNIIKKSTPDERVWISFDPEAGLYTVEGRGAEVPEDWTGYVPVEEVAEESDED